MATGSSRETSVGRAKGGTDSGTARTDPRRKLEAPARRRTISGSDHGPDPARAA